MHPTKRRRTDSAALTLNKPFRSPLAVTHGKNKSSPEKQNNANLEEPELPSVSNPSDVTQPASSPPRPLLSNARQHRVQYSSSPVRPSTFHSNTRDAVCVALQKQHSSLLLKLKDLNSSLDAATQALKVVQSGNDDDLQQLVAKWKIASRGAAEELFSTAKDKVDRMGGVGVWRDKYMKPREHEPWGNELDFDEDELSMEQKEQLEIIRDEARIESEKYGLHQQQPLLDVKDDDSFTIDLMLKQLNVDLDAIGFDAQIQRWVD